MTSQRSHRKYAPPRLFSAPVPLVEELLAVGYKKQAERWAEHARVRKKRARVGEGR